MVTDGTQRMEKIWTLTNTTANFYESVLRLYLKLTAILLHTSKIRKNMLKLG